jgi:class 3 adenylate cyclase
MTDLVRSTAMVDRVGPAAAEELRTEHFRLAAWALERTGGREVKNPVVGAGSAAQQGQFGGRGAGRGDQRYSGVLAPGPGLRAGVERFATLAAGRAANASANASLVRRLVGRR